MMDIFSFDSPNNIWIEAMLNNPFQGMLAIDANGTIVFVNDFFSNLLSCSSKDMLGKKIWDIIPDCSLYDTVLKGYSQWGETLKLNGREFIIARFPLKNKKRIIGAIVKTLFPDMITAREIINRLSHPVAYGSVFNKPLCCCADIIGESEPMLLVKKLARKAARSSSTLLITGESGTGKGILAEAIHNRSIRSKGPFIKVNCAAIPENLIESELFGYVDGAFTGAKRGGNPGKFELANGGTIFLDEIGDMPIFMQPKLLQILQEKQVQRIGSGKYIDLDVRVIAATNQKLENLVAEHKFREDLYYRLKVLQIDIPPLRERIDDLPLFIDGLIAKINRKISSDAKGVTADSLRILQSYSWPGNVRELENFLEQAINWSYDSIIDVNKLPFTPWKNNSSLNPVSATINHTTNDADKLSFNNNYQTAINKTEKKLIIEALIESNGNKSKAAEKLNIHRSVLYRKLKKFNIQCDNPRFNFETQNIEET